MKHWDDFPPITEKLPNNIFCKILANHRIHVSVLVRPGAEMVACDKWKASTGGVYYFFGRVGKWASILTLATNALDDKLITGAGFDLENTNNVIKATKIEQIQTTSSDPSSTSLAFGNYSPQYRAITSALSQLGSEQDLAWAKMILIQLASIFRSTILSTKERGEPRLNPALAWSLASKAKTFWSDYCRSARENRGKMHMLRRRQETTSWSCPHITKRNRTL